MHSDFSILGRSARELITVPDLSIEAIRVRSHAAGVRARVRALFVCGVAAVAVLGAAGIGTNVSGVRVWLFGNKGAIAVGSLVMVRQPTVSDVRDVAAHATFPIVFPVGMPAGTRVGMLLFSPAGHPNAVSIQYRNERTGFKAAVTFFDSRAVNTNAALLPGGSARPPLREVSAWRAGGETVVGPNGHGSAGALSRIKAVTLKTSAAQSLAATETMVGNVAVLGGPPQLAALAERYAPANARSVLLDPQHIRAIPSLVSHRRPILDSRVVYLTDIPSVGGAPDYSKATLRWPVTAISASGVRAVAAVTRGSCDCEILFNQPAAGTYWIWKIPLSGSAVKKYSVNARTLVVTAK